MKSFLIIPMGGTGSRFVKAGYETYKPFLPAEGKFTILDNIIKNFRDLNSQLIVLANLKFLKKSNLNYLKKKRCKIIDIPNHKKGPLYSIFLGLRGINKIIKDNHNIFICYSDINWAWKAKSVKKKILNTNAAIFTHTGFHPHLHVNSQSDFCLKKNNKILSISEKKIFGKDYQNELLATGCYYIKKLNYLNTFFLKNKLKNKKEYYLTTFVKHLLKYKINIKSINIEKFVHLGVPDQYEDYLKWRRHNLELKNSFRKQLKNKSTIMLMGGKGRRLSDITNFKPFLLVKNEPIFQLVFDNLNSKEKIIITNNYYKKKLIKKKYKIIFVKQTKSMFDTIYASRNFLQNKSNYFLTSCDCIGIADKRILGNFLKKNKKDLVFFAFKFSYFQKSLGNSHTHLIINKNKITNIKVKSRYNGLGYGHAGFFWIKSTKVFKYLDFFKNSSFYKNLKREVLIDDYFKFLVIKKLISTNHFLLEDYIHIGSKKEYREYNYWSNYFNEKKLA
tara:strand:- start:3590 stop:5098 length:1509 start_codon:yes stop_codon:yes gene_type:complete